MAVDIEQIEAELAELRAAPEPTTALVSRLNALASHFSYELAKPFPDDPMRALAFSQEAQAIAERIDDEAGLARSIYLQSVANNQLGERDLAFSQALAALATAERLGERGLVADAHRVIAEMASVMAIYAEGLDHGMTALRLYRELNQAENEALAQTALSNIYSGLGEFAQALAAEQAALRIRQELDLPLSVAISLNNLAYVHLLSGDPAAARPLIEACLELCDQLRQQGIYISGYGYYLDTMAELLWRTGDLDGALAYQRRVLAENRTVDGQVRSSELEAYCTIHLGHIHRLRGELPEARAMLEQAIGYCALTSSHQPLAVAHRELATIHEAQGNYEHALVQLKHWHATERQNFDEQAERRVRGLHVLHETEAARREAQLYQQRHEEQAAIIADLERARSELQEALNALGQQSAEQARLLAEIESQRATISELSVPVLPLTSTTLLMPLVGALDTARLRQIQQGALLAIQRFASRWLLLDITGVPVVDERIAQDLLETVRAARLLGAKVVLVGIRPEVAQAMVSLDLGMRDLPTTASLQSALTMLGILVEQDVRW